ncbi:hypothetical protein ACGYK5_17150 [Sulfitobacter sp. 1A16787]|uniref:hypothetical protein n=1 Tax=Sulfitobacter sp. 1A16787 TaxID=3368571 RepID=UPI0037464A7B
MRKLPVEVRADVVKAIERNTKQGVRVARVLAPDVSGRTKREIMARFTAGGMVGIVEAIDPQAPREEKDRAYSIEHGRKKGDRGTTEGTEHMHTTRSYMAERAKKSVARAVRKAAKRVAGNV